MISCAERTENGRCRARALQSSGSQRDVRGVSRSPVRENRRAVSVSPRRDAAVSHAGAARSLAECSHRHRRTALAAEHVDRAEKSHSRAIRRSRNGRAPALRASRLRSVSRRARRDLRASRRASGVSVALCARVRRSGHVERGAARASPSFAKSGRASSRRATTRWRSCALPFWAARTRARWRSSTTNPKNKKRHPTSSRPSSSSTSTRCASPI